MGKMALEVMSASQANHTNYAAVAVMASVGAIPLSKPKKARSE